MEIPFGWRRVRAGSSDGTLVLTVDFEAPGRAEATFAHLAALLRTPHELWATIPPPSGNPQSHSDFWLAGLRADGRPVTAVLGYCVGALYASEIADRITPTQSRPPEILFFDPESPTRSGLVDEFHSAVDRLAPMMSADEAVRARRTAAEADRKAEDLAQLGAALGRIFGELVSAVFARAGLDEELAVELADIFESLMAYLTDAASLTPHLARRPATVLRSRGRGGTALDFNLSHDELLGSREVADAVARVLR